VDQDTARYTGGVMTARRENAGRAPGAFGTTQQRPGKDTTTVANRGRRRYLVSCLFMGLLTPEHVARAVRREIEREGER